MSTFTQRCIAEWEQLSSLTEQLATRRSALDQLERGLAEARAIIDRQRAEVYFDPYPGAFGYLEATVASYLSKMATELPVRHHGRSPSPPSPGEVR